MHMISDSPATFSSDLFVNCRAFCSNGLFRNKESNYDN